MQSGKWFIIGFTLLTVSFAQLTYDEPGYFFILPSDPETPNLEQFFENIAAAGFAFDAAAAQSVAGLDLPGLEGYPGPDRFTGAAVSLNFNFRRGQWSQDITNQPCQGILLLLREREDTGADDRPSPVILNEIKNELGLQDIVLGPYPRTSLGTGGLAHPGIGTYGANKLLSEHHDNRESPVRLAIIDTGVSNPEIFNLTNDGFNFVDGNDDFSDNSMYSELNTESTSDIKEGHGTPIAYLASQVAERTDFADFEVQPIKVCELNPETRRCHLRDVVIGMCYALHTAKVATYGSDYSIDGADTPVTLVMNLSLGITHSELYNQLDEQLGSEYPQDNSLPHPLGILGRVMFEITMHNGLIAVSDGYGDDVVYPAEFVSGNDSGAISVTVLPEEGLGYSLSAELAAPGVMQEAITPTGNYDYYTGTSFATAHVAGLLTVIRQQTQASGAAIENCIKQYLPSQGSGMPLPFSPDNQLVTLVNSIVTCANSAQ